MTDPRNMLSRVADHLYWMSRYLERAEHTARLVDVYSNLRLEMSARDLQSREKLLASLTLEDIAESLSDDEALFQITFDVENQASIVGAITSARENAANVREQVSSEMWTQLNTLYLHLRGANADQIWADSPHDFYMEVRNGSHLFQGITDATMNHDQGWHFIQLGRYIERALNLVTLLDVHLRGDIFGEKAISTERYFELVSTLKSVTAFEAYCKVYNPNVQPTPMVEFLLYDREFPRSLRFCVDQVLISLHAVGDTTGRNKGARLYRVAGRLQSMLSFDETQDIDNFHQYLMSIKQQVHRIHDTLYKTFITYAIESAL